MSRFHLFIGARLRGRKNWAGKQVPRHLIGMDKIIGENGRVNQLFVLFCFLIGVSPAHDGFKLSVTEDDHELLKLLLPPTSSEI